jgi:hypothetical protein
VHTDLSSSFNVHGVVYVVGDGQSYLSILVWNLVLICLRIIDVVAPIEREIRKLAAGLVSVKDEQEYIIVREKTHRNTAESTNSRVKWWSVLQAIVLFSVVAWQVYYLKVSFTQVLSIQCSTYIFSLSLK